jgi:ABC-type transport system substrate-binding protein
MDARRTGCIREISDYVPRQEEASWLAGGKRIVTDQIEWIVMPDPSTAAAALQTGEIDWWEIAIPDLVPTLMKNRNLVVDIQDPLGNIGFLIMNQAHPPNDARARRAILMAMSQEEYMRAFVGDNANLWKPLPSYLAPGTPFTTRTAAKSSRAHAIWRPPSGYWRRAVTQASQSYAWQRRIYRTTRRGATSPLIS